ncbi:TATA box-binding protein-like 1 [Sergentomyia squamirostris]
MFSLSGESGMATLLQQRSMKTLANGGGNGASGATGASTAATAVLLPHEIVSVPVTPGATQLVQDATGARDFHQQQFTNFIQYSNYTTTNFTPTTSYQVVSSSSIFSNNHPHQQQTLNQSLMTSSSSTAAASSNVVVISPESVVNGALNATHSTALNPDDIIEEDDGIDGSKVTDDCDSANGVIKDEISAEVSTVDEEQEAEPEVDIVINNVVCSFSVRCHLDLRKIALNGFNVEFRRENGMVTMKLRRPYTTASIWSSGKITCTGATSEDQAKIAARRYARCLQKLGFTTRFNNFRVVNVLGTCSMPWGIKIVNFSEKYRKDASYEPELHPGVTYKLKIPKATLKIFSTGSITVTAGSVAHVQAAIEHIFPLVYEFRKPRAPVEVKPVPEVVTTDPAQSDDFWDEQQPMDQPPAKRRKKIKRPFGRPANDTSDNIMYVSDVEDDVSITSFYSFI